jgi:predicted ATPase
MPIVREVTIENYKSIRKLTVELGRVNVLIGANGSGKSNLLEAIGYGSAAARGKLDNEYLAPRGIRVVEPRFTRSAFPGKSTRSIKIKLQLGDDALEVNIRPERGDARSVAPVSLPLSKTSAFRKYLENARKKKKRPREWPGPAELIRLLQEFDAATPVRAPDFLIYAPENSALRIFQSEPQVMPIGVRGEGLFAHLKVLGAKSRKKAVSELAEGLALLDWFAQFEIPKDLAAGERSLLIRDRFLASGALFDQRSANEGFLFLLFYLTVFISDQTPAFFAIDNVDAGLNPKLITKVVRALANLAVAHGKQVIFTTHNPAVLDGIDLHDDEHRLLVAERAHDEIGRASCRERVS